VDTRILGALSRAKTRAGYRAWQFFHGLRPALSPAEVAEARARLSSAEWALFLAQEPRDRRHAFDLYRAHLEEGANDAALVAALVHDVGKGRLRAWQRVAFVLLEAGAPPLAQAVEAEHGAEWRRGLWRLREHGRLGAALLRAAGSAPRVVELVERHTDPPPLDDPELTRFIVLDDRF